MPKEPPEKDAPPPEPKFVAPKTIKCVRKVRKPCAYRVSLKKERLKFLDLRPKTTQNQHPFFKDTLYI